MRVSVVPCPPQQLMLVLIDCVAVAKAGYALRKRGLLWLIVLTQVDTAPSGLFLVRVHAVSDRGRAVGRESVKSSVCGRPCVRAQGRGPVYPAVNEDWPHGLPACKGCASGLHLRASPQGTTALENSTSAG